MSVQWFICNVCGNEFSYVATGARMATCCLKCGSRNITKIYKKV